MVYMRYRLWLNSTELEGCYKLVGSELVLRTRAMYSLYTLLTLHIEKGIDMKTQLLGERQIYRFLPIRVGMCGYTIGSW